MTSYDYIIMIIVDSCIIWFHLDCIMKLKKSYYIATNICSKKVLLLLVISLAGKLWANRIIRNLNFKMSFEGTSCIYFYSPISHA